MGSVPREVGAHIHRFWEGLLSTIFILQYLFTLLNCSLCRFRIFSSNVIAEVTVTCGAFLIERVPVYAFKDKGDYLNMIDTTYASGVLVGSHCDP